LIESINTGASGYKKGSKASVAGRAAILRKAVNTLEQQVPWFCALRFDQAFKTLGDAVAELREEVGFARYCAAETERIMEPVALPGPTGETNELPALVMLA